MATVREMIKSGLEVIDNKEVIPNRTEEEMKAELEERGILDQKYEARSQGDYKPTRPEDMITNTGSEDSEEANSDDKEAIGSIKHTDGYLIDGKFISCVAAKATTAVLDSTKTARYHLLKFSINYKRTDSDTMEATIPDFVKAPMDLPRGTKSTIVGGKFIAIEPQVNGFSLAVLVEEIPDGQYEELKKLENWLVNYQGAILEKVLTELDEAGVPQAELIKNQLAVGLVAQLRRRFERDIAEDKKQETQAEKIVITHSIREQSANVADKINTALKLVPLTSQSVGFGLDHKVITKTTDKDIIDSWESHKAGVSYFTQGNTYGRIEIINQSKRYIPLTSSMTPKVTKELKRIIPSVITLFENVTRAQLGDLPLLPSDSPAYETLIKPTKQNIIDLFNGNRKAAYRTKMKMIQIGQGIADKERNHSANISKYSLLEKYLIDDSKDNSKEESSTADEPEEESQE